MKKIIVLSALLSSQLLMAGQTITPGDEAYYKTDLKGSNTQFIFSESSKYMADNLAKREAALHAEYEKYFGYKLDQTLYVTLVSERSQYPNSFAGQYPMNIQALFMGGAQLPDYMASKSWAGAILYHETAHNYQVNPKASSISRGLHTVFGNNAWPITLGPIPIPAFAVPNQMLTSYLLEGNAVLNESWHGNGGRLYNGYLKAMTIEQAKEGNINSAFLFNQDTYDFPYGERTYILGGFFQYYLASTYGLEKTDQFFYNHSKSWSWPFRTNHIFKMTFGVTFDQATSDYNKWLLSEAEGFVEAEGEPIATSIFHNQFGDNCDKIFFNISDGIQEPELVRFFKKDKAVDIDRDNFFAGRMVNRHDEYYTINATHTSPMYITQGLYDHDGMLLDGSEDKIVYGYIKDDVPVYADAKRSGIEPQLYVGDEYYGTAHSSVYIDSDDNIYYFRQEAKQRTLYKNKTPIYTMTDFYGFPVGVDKEERVYFVANSAKGSSLFRVDASGKAERVSKADNIVDARLINEDEVLIAAINGKEYYYVVNAMVPTSEGPTETRLTLEDHEYYNGAANFDTGSALPNEDLPMENGYYSPLNLKYSASTLSLGSAKNEDDESIFTYNVNLHFEDPMMTNTLDFFAQQNVDEIGLYGGTYTNNRHLLSFGGTVYGVYGSGKDENKTRRPYNESNQTWGKEQDLNVDSRDFGFSVFADLPVYQHGYRSANLAVSYYQDYDDNARAPLVVEGSVAQYEQYPLATDPAFYQNLTLFGTFDRGDVAFGGDYALSHSLPWKFYIGMNLKGVYTDFDGVDNNTSVKDEDYTRGIKFTPYQTDVVGDPSIVVMKNLRYSRSVKQALVGGVHLAKQFDGRLLFFTFPLSVVRERVYGSYNYFDIADYGQTANKFSTHSTFNEFTAGAEVELRLLNFIPIPLALEYVYNKEACEETVVDDASCDEGRFVFGSSFAF